jgi:hypothetical protein
MNLGTVPSLVPASTLSSSSWVPTHISFSTPSALPFRGRGVGFWSGSPHIAIIDRLTGFFLSSMGTPIVVDGFLSMSLGSALSCCNIHVVVASCDGLALALALIGFSLSLVSSLWKFVRLNIFSKIRLKRAK